MSRQDSRLIERTVAAMETLLASGVQQVRVIHVLQLLGRDVPEGGAPSDPQPQTDPAADPLTGCLPVTAQGDPNGADSKEDRSVRQVGFRG